MAMQLAYYRHTGGEVCGTYESIMTRPFLHGRTEVGRSCSVDSLAFSQAMDDNSIPGVCALIFLQSVG